MTHRYSEHLTLRLSHALLARAQRIAATRELRLSELCRDALRKHLDHIERGGAVAVAHTRGVE